MKLSKRVLRPCKYIVLRIFKLRIRKRLFAKFQRRKQPQQQQQQQQQHSTNDKDSPKFSTKKTTVSFKSVLHLLKFRRKTKDIVHMDRIMELKSLSPAAAVENQEKSCIRTRSKITSTSTSTNNVTAGSDNEEKSSSRTPGRSTGSRGTNVFTGVGKTESSEEVEEACRSFENYLAEMIVEEGRMKDLMDVEQLLYCWNNLRCPIFIDLVSTFYGELCKDLFSSN